MQEVLTVAPVDHAGRRVHAVEHHLGADDRGADAIAAAGIGHLGAIDDVHGRRRNGCRGRRSQSGRRIGRQCGRGGRIGCRHGCLAPCHRQGCEKSYPCCIQPRGSLHASTPVSFMPKLMRQRRKSWKLRATGDPPLTCKAMAGHCSWVPRTPGTASEDRPWRGFFYLCRIEDFWVAIPIS